MSDFKRGDLVVTSYADDAQVYVVSEIKGNGAHLYYKAPHQWLSGGWCDLTLIKKPVTKQIDRYIDHLHGEIP